MRESQIPPGKLPGQLLFRLLSSSGPLPRDVLMGPALGEDACALDLGGGVLVAATDPITFSSSDLGRSAVLINANDVAVSGVRPRWFLAAVLLPPGTTEQSVEDIFTSMNEGLAEIGATLVGGHTEVTSAVNRPVVVGQMLGYAADGTFVSTSGVSSGDAVVQVGPVPVEGAAVLAVEAAERLASLPSEVLAAARDALRDPGISVVDAALAAASLGATSMHDPTEGGLASGLHELSAAAGLAVRVERDEVRWFDPGVHICRALGADPWGTLASGSLLATFPPGLLAGALAELSARGYTASAIGSLHAGEGVRDSTDRVIPWPERDEVARVLMTRDLS